MEKTTAISANPKTGQFIILILLTNPSWTVDLRLEA